MSLIGTLKKAALVTLALGVAGTAVYSFVPSVKETVDRKVEEAKAIWDLKKVIEPVENINYDQFTSVLSFDEAKYADTYTITFDDYKNNTQHTFTSSEPSLKIALPKEYVAGDKVRFTVSASGPETETLYSIDAKYSYELLDLSQRYQEETFQFFLDKISQFMVLDSYYNASVSDFRYYYINNVEFGSGEFENQMKATGLVAKGARIEYFDIIVNLKDLNIENIDPQNAEELYKFLDSIDMQLTNEDIIYTPEEHISMIYYQGASILSNFGVFDQYLNQGYSIETIDERLERTDDDTVNYIVGQYRAVKEGYEPIYFEQKNEFIANNPNFIQLYSDVFLLDYFENKYDQKYFTVSTIYSNEIERNQYLELLESLDGYGYLKRFNTRVNPSPEQTQE